MTNLEFRRWVRNARPRDQVVYHVGALGADRGLHVNGKNRTAWEVQVDMLAKEVAKAADDQLVTLTQRRVDFETAEYLATKR